MFGGICIILGLFHAPRRGGSRHRNAVHLRRLLGQRLWLDQARLGICVDVGLDRVRDRVTRRRALFARSQDRLGALNSAALVSPERRRYIVRRDAQAVCPPGEVAEWLKAPHSKCGIRATVSGVRIPPSPPSCSALGWRANTQWLSRPVGNTGSSHWLHVRGASVAADLSASIFSRSALTEARKHLLNNPAALAPRAGLARHGSYRRLARYRRGEVYPWIFDASFRSPTCPQT